MDMGLSLLPQFWGLRHKPLQPATIIFYFNILNYFCVECFACLHVCAPTCVVPAQVGGEHWIRWNKSYTLLGTIMWVREPNLGLLPEQSVLLTPEPSLLPQFYFWFI